MFKPGDFDMTFQPSLSSGAALVGVLRLQNDIEALRERLAPAIDCDWKLMAVLSITSLLVVTYVITWWQSTIAMRSYEKHGRRPPILPYWLPYLGHLVPFLRDGPRLAAELVYVRNTLYIDGKESLIVASSMSEYVADLL